MDSLELEKQRMRSLLMSKDLPDEVRLELSGQVTHQQGPGKIPVTYYNHMYEKFALKPGTSHMYMPHLVNRMDIKDTETNAITGDCCFLGWNSMALLKKNDGGQFNVQSMFKLTSKAKGEETGAHAKCGVKTEISGSTVPITKITTLSVSSCTFLSIMSGDTVFVAHSDFEHLEGLRDTVMKMSFDKECKVFASRIRHHDVTRDESKIVQEMIEHINPSEGYVIDRGDPDDMDGCRLLGHNEIGMTIDAATNTFSIMGDIVKGQTPKHMDQAMTAEFGKLQDITVSPGNVS